jgi:lysine 2,3-aminomutase
MDHSRRAFPAVSEADWGDWRWQQRNMLRGVADLEGILDLTPDERRGLSGAAGRFRVGTTPYYASLMDPHHPSCPVRMQVVPVAAETGETEGDLRDPLGEDGRRPVRAIVHKYPDRALFLAADHCAVYCRHCTRRRITGGEEGAFDRESAAEGIAWVRSHPEVRDVVVSGGDPLALSDDRLGWILEELRAIRHVELLRVATRAPVVNPMRVTGALAALLRRLAPIFVVTHFNHPKECTPEARGACERLVDQGVPVENQTVLLRGVNSTARIIADLNHRLLSWRVRPYYLHQGDLAEGTGHLRTPLATGLGILEELRGRTSGLAVPHLAVDLPGGAGKVTLQPGWLLGPGEPGVPPALATGTAAAPGTARGHWLRSWRGKPVFYPEPRETNCACPYDEVFYGERGALRQGGHGW